MCDGEYEKQAGIDDRQRKRIFIMRWNMSKDASLEWREIWTQNEVRTKSFYDAYDDDDDEMILSGHWSSNSVEPIA